MCFVTDDHGWIAREQENSNPVSDGTKTFICDDCGCIVPQGEECLLIEMWEHEHCSECSLHHNEMDECDEGSNGESCSIVRCNCCLDFRSAIRDMELKEGCGEHESVPQGSIAEEFGDIGDGTRVKEYVDHAIAMFPAREAEFLDRWSHYWKDE